MHATSPPLCSATLYSSPVLICMALPQGHLSWHPHPVLGSIAPSPPSGLMFRSLFIILVLQKEIAVSDLASSTFLVQECSCNEQEKRGGQSWDLGPGSYSPFLADAGSVMHRAVASNILSCFMSTY